MARGQVGGLLVLRVSCSGTMRYLKHATPEQAGNDAVSGTRQRSESTTSGSSESQDSRDDDTREVRSRGKAQRSLLLRIINAGANPREVPNM